MRFVFCTQYRPWTLVITRNPAKCAPAADRVKAARGADWARAAYSALIDEIRSIRLQCFFALAIAVSLAAPAFAVAVVNN